MSAEADIEKYGRPFGENWTHHAANRKDRDAEWESGREADEESHIAIQSTDSCRIKKKEKDEVVGQARRLPVAKRGNPPQAGRPTMASLPDLRSAKARFIEPMKAKLVEEPPATGDWIYELKFDGIRLIGVKKDDKEFHCYREMKTN